jgi:hypothetical protein
MKHPVRSDFDATVTEMGVSVTFKPTSRTYSFVRLPDAHDIARLGPVSTGGIPHGEPSADTKDYDPDEIQDVAHRVASDVAASVWSVQDEEATNKLTTVRPPSIVGDEGD